VARALVLAAGRHPMINSTWADSEIIVKPYVHLGIAVAAERGLIVPNVKDADQLPLRDLADALTALVQTAKSGRTAPADMSGGTFTISSLGGIGGTHFTPIVNAPEVAIMGVVRSKTAPVWDGATFQPRLMLPLSVSYDHRVIDGALAARFLRHVCHVLEDVRRLVL